MESPEDYCRQIESYLCRKNDGHLVRIVGPAFEQVCGWAARGIPLKLACRGIDRYFERYYAKGPRRRPVRIEFCEADVLDAFDEWRRAVGVPAPEAGAADAGEPAPARHESLPAHLERVIARLTTVRAGTEPTLDAAIEAAVRELDAMRADAKGLRGGARERVLERLRTLEAELVQVARSRLDATALRAVEHDADDELAPFRERMPREAYAQAREACVNRIVRDRARLPRVAIE